MSTIKTNALTDLAGATRWQQTRNAAVATTSGSTVVVCSNIPSWVTKITLHLKEVSTTGTNLPYFQVGYGGTPTWVTSGIYNSTYGYFAAGSSSTVGGSTTGTGFSIYSSAAANTITGRIVFELLDSAAWTYGCHGTYKNTTTQLGNIAGVIDVGNQVTAIRIGTADAFDAGSVIAIYE